MGGMSPHRRKQIRKRLLKIYSNCWLCGNYFPERKEITLDHIVPLSKGGKDSAVNIMLAHQFCNQRRGNRFVCTETETCDAI